MLDGATEAEPRGQRDAARGLQRQIGEVENDQAEASAFEKQVGRAQDLLESLFCNPIGFRFEKWLSQIWPSSLSG